ncbi:MAG TPA: hypothetical protein VHP83_18845 [Aggregatilineaceae bacterium]|nr:hypothetical protein [Aggregatilineaceae bacterium]
MGIKVERFPDESIVHAVVDEPFDPEQDMRAMFAEFIRLRLAIQGDVALILNVDRISDKPNAFSEMMVALAHASRGIKASREAGLMRPPITIFVGSGPVAALASEAMEQTQYGGARAHLCNSETEAIALAREKLTSPG